MADRIRWVMIVCLSGLYIATIMAVLHPHVSANYRAFMITHTSRELYIVHEPGTPEQGIVFSRTPLPQWISTTFGLSFREPGGRWTDNQMGNVAGLAFEKPFNGAYCVQFTAAAMPQLGNHFGLRFGGEFQTVQVKSTAPSQYRVSFPDVRTGDKLEFVLPKDLPRGSDLNHSNPDERRVGLKLVELKILPGTCEITAKP